MKKALLVIGVLLVLLVAAIIVLPVIFKDDIVAVVKEEANNSVNASINFSFLLLMALFYNFIVSRPPIYFLNTSGISIEPSSF